MTPLVPGCRARAIPRAWQIFAAEMGGGLLSSVLGAQPSASDHECTFWGRGRGVRCWTVSKKRRARWFTYGQPCVRCANRVVAILDVATDLPYLQCVDCELGFSEPAAIEGPGGEVFNSCERPGGVRPATAEDLARAGWNVADFIQPS